MIDSETFTNSSNFITEIRSHLVRPHITDLFGTFETKADWSDKSITIAQRTKALKEPSVVASGIGANKTGQHYDLIIHDDMNTDRNSNTPEKCQKVIDHYRLNLSILEPGGTLVIIGTRYSANDLYAFILENELGLDPFSPTFEGHI